MTFEQKKAKKKRTFEPKKLHCAMTLAKDKLIYSGSVFCLKLLRFRVNLPSSLRPEKSTGSKRHFLLSRQINDAG